MYGLTEKQEQATKQVTCRDRLAEGASAACCKAKYRGLGNQWMPDIERGEGAVGWEFRNAGGAIAREKKNSGQEIYLLLAGDASRVIREGFDNWRAI